MHLPTRLLVHINMVYFYSIFGYRYPLPRSRLSAPEVRAKPLHGLLSIPFIFVFLHDLYIRSLHHLSIRTHS